VFNLHITVILVKNTETVCSAGSILDLSHGSQMC